MGQAVVCVRLAGGIGNQFFQVFAAYLIVSRLYQIQEISLFSGALGSYASKRDSFFKIDATLGGLVLSDCLKEAPLLWGGMRLVEKMGLYRLHLRMMTRWRSVAGYCQNMPSEHFSSESVLNFRSALRGYLLQGSSVARQRLPTMGGVLHVRGGDALLPENASRYSVSVAYYVKVASEIEGMVYVFSDDERYAKELLDTISNPNFQYICSERGEEYLCAALGAPRMVLSKSTLSFWAGMLSEAEELVIPASYPSGWIALLRLTGKRLILIAE